MLKRFIGILLIICTLSANFARLFVFAGFEMNQNYIAKTLCENRSRPWMHCQGKCYLMKKIKAAEEKEKSAERETQKSLFQEALTDSNYTVRFTSQLLQVMECPYRMPAHQNITIKLLQPPRLA